MSLKFEPIMFCPKCDKEVSVDEELCQDGPHFSKIRCSQCQYFFGFRAKPKNDPKNEKRPPCPTPKELGIFRCQICLRDITEVTRQYLCTHHIDDEPTNNDRLNLLVVCQACHKLIHWTRTYMDD